jgi:KaiC/GvpD/RAD55 family RecA-like ATPase
LFDSEESLGDGVAQFLGEGLARNDQMLVVVRAERWYSILMRLAALGRSADEAVRFGRLIVRDAKHTQHDGVRSNPEDVLGSFLVSRYHAV